MKLENILPIAAPAPPALVMGALLYKEIIAALSPDWWHVAFIAAALGVVGMIGAEMYSYKQAAIAFAEGEQGATVAALIGGLITSALIVFAIWNSGENARPLIASVIIAIVAYMVLSVRDYLARKRGQARQTQDAELATIGATIRLTNAQARLAKAGGGVQLSSPRNGQNGQTGQPRIVADSPKVAAIKSFWRDNPNASLRDCAAACNCSPETARKWKAEQ